MNNDFGDWYRSAGITPDSEKLPKRWEAIEAYVAGRDEVVSLTRLFYQLGEPNQQFLTEFRTEFQKPDPAFPMKGNDRELIVLAGAELIDVMQRSPHDVADLATLCVVCAAAQNLRKSPAVPEIPEIAARHLSKRSMSRAKSSPNENGFTDKSLASLATEVQNLRSKLAVIDEESNILWWLISEYSRDLDKRWRKFPVQEVSIVVGKELADLTRVIPGPVAAAAFLDRVVQSGRTKSVSSVSVINALCKTPLEWRQGYVKEAYPNELEPVLPLSHGLKLSLSAPDEDAFPPLFEKATGISANAKLAPYILAYQMFLEVLVRRSFNAVE